MSQRPKKTANEAPNGPEPDVEHPKSEECEKGDYYYDDSHGYQTYNGGDDDQFEDDDE
ncbi:MAG: hypothetical protein ABJA02_05210 [Acidobacteriota bacterium]